MAEYYKEMLKVNHLISTAHTQEARNKAVALMNDILLELIDIEAENE